jgi:hypothetical protein
LAVNARCRGRLAESVAGSEHSQNEIHAPIQLHARRLPQTCVCVHRARGRARGECNAGNFPPRNTLLHGDCRKTGFCHFVKQPEQFPEPPKKKTTAQQTVQ